MHIFMVTLELIMLLKNRDRTQKQHMLTHVHFCHVHFRMGFIVSTFSSNRFNNGIDHGIVQR